MKPKFEIMSEEVFYAVDYNGKEYTLQSTHQCNPDYYDNTVYDSDGNKEKDGNIIDEILEAFSKLEV